MFQWILFDDNGGRLRSTEEFESRTDAEAWMTAHWSELVDEGGDKVTLVEGDVVVYEMGLGAE